MITTTAAVPLTAADRCDRCGARAYLRVVLPGGSDLLFCAHHGRTHESALRRAAATFEDQRDDLARTSNSAPDDQR